MKTDDIIQEFSDKISKATTNNVRIDVNTLNNAREKLIEYQKTLQKLFDLYEFVQEELPIDFKNAVDADIPPEQMLDILEEIENK